MDTQWLLLGRYNGDFMIPAETVCRNHFAPLTYPKFLEKTNNGSIPLPVTRMTDSTKAPRYVHIKHLAAYLDRRAELAEREARSMAS